MPPSDTDALILDAAMACLADAGLARLRLEVVAARAGVSRQTLYRRFGSREGLVTAAVAREEQRLLALVITATAGQDDLEGTLRGAIATLLVWTRDHPLLQKLLAAEPEGLLPLLASGDARVLASARTAVLEVIGPRLPPDADAPAAADLLSRILLSYAIDPPVGDPDEVAAALARTLVRGITSGSPSAPG